MDKEAIGVILLVILLIIAAMLLFSFIGAWLWNITIPYIFGLPYVEWWHITAMMILIWIILPSRTRCKESK